MGDFLSLLQVDQVSTLRFVNLCHKENFRKRLFGGQVLAQSLMAAGLSVDEIPVHSLHAYFLRSGRSDVPVYYDVEKLRDGRSISTRRVLAMQNDQCIFAMSASFHEKEKGFEHHSAMPENIPSPETLLAAQSATASDREEGPAEHAEDVSNPFILLPVPENLFTSTEQHEPDACFWLRTQEALPRNTLIQSAALAFVSDLGLLATTALPHPTSLFSKDIVAASIDHALWLHDNDFDLHDWLFVRIHSPWAGNARGFAQASIYTRDGRLIANTAQEGLIRPLS